MTTFHVKALYTMTTFHVKAAVVLGALATALAVPLGSAAAAGASDHPSTVTAGITRDTVTDDEVQRSEQHRPRFPLPRRRGKGGRVVPVTRRTVKPVGRDVMCAERGTEHVVRHGGLLEDSRWHVMHGGLPTCDPAGDHRRAVHPPRDEERTEDEIREHERREHREHEHHGEHHHRHHRLISDEEVGR